MKILLLMLKENHQEAFITFTRHPIGHAGAAIPKHTAPFHPIQPLCTCISFQQFNNHYLKKNYGSNYIVQNNFSLLILLIMLFISNLLVVNEDLPKNKDVKDHCLFYFGIHFEKRFTLEMYD